MTDDTPLLIRRVRPSSAPTHPCPDWLQATTRALPQGTVIMLSGDLDIATAPLLTGRPWQPVARPGPYLVADLSAPTFCDCTGLGALLLLHCRAFENGGWLRPAAATTAMRKLLRITGLDSVLRAFPSIDDAFTAPAMYPALGRGGG